MVVTTDSRTARLWFQVCSIAALAANTSLLRLRVQPPAQQLSEEFSQTLPTALSFKQTILHSLRLARHIYPLLRWTLALHISNPAAKLKMPPKRRALNHSQIQIPQQQASLQEQRLIQLRQEESNAQQQEAIRHRQNFLQNRQQGAGCCQQQVSASR